ncbi:MBG domain-containing protein, partial [Pseudomonas aeruginosa]
VSGLKNGDTAGAVLNGGSLSRVAGENVGVYGINQGGLALNSGNYDLSYQGNNLTITKALLNVIADGKTKVYGDADPSLTYQVSGLKNGDSAGSILTGGLNRVAGENVGVYGINQGDLALNSGNYDLSYQGNNLTITKALLNVIADAKTKVYGDADPALTYQVSGLKNGDTAGAVLNGGSLSRVAGENVGVYGINQGGLALNSGNYDLSYQGNNLTITKALLNVIADGKTKVYGDADPSLTYQVSGLKNGDSAGSILTGGLNRVAGENVGVYGINQGDLALNSGNYDLSYQGNNLTITKALLNVIADAKTKVYGDADPSLTYQVSGLKNGDTAGAVLNGGGLVRVSGENVGNYAIQQGGLGLVSGNYDLAYQGNNLTITKALLNVIADAKTKVYGDADPSLTYQVSGLKNGDSAGSILTGGLNRAAGENVGVYGINQGDLALNSGNYDLSYQGNNLTITKALLNVIADAKTKVYGDADPALTYQVSGLKNGDTAGAVLNGGSLSRVAGENVGVYGINQGGLALNSGNYDLSYQGNNLTITKALLNVIADGKTKVYGDADPSLTYQVSGLKNGDSAGSILTGGRNRVAGGYVGVYGINQGDLALNSGNYDLSYQGNNLTITKALLNVIADGKTKVYGDADPSLTYQVSGLKNGDSAGSILTGGLNRVAGENVGVYGINQGDLALNSGNYDLSYQGNNLTITKALLNVIADAKTKVYGDADPSLTYQVSGLKNGDTAGAVLNGGSLSRVAGENVGVYGINQGGLGLVSGNYDLAYQGNNLTITKALLNVIADGKTKVYGDADPSLTYQVSGLKNGDSAGSILTGGLNRAAGENVGVYGINQGDLALNSGNYDLSYQGNNLTITKALLNVIADAKTKVYGDADPSLTYQVSGLKNGDTAGAVLNGGSLSREAGENVGVYGIYQGGLGLVSGNYDLAYQGNILSITKALLNVIADGTTKVYGDADPSLTYQVSGLKNGDSAGSILTGGLNRAAGENVGVYGINQGDLALNSGNYDLSYQGNNLTITKALLNVIADAKTKVYGDADPSLTYQVSGLKNGDSAGSILTGGLNRAAGENVGVYGINQGDLALNSGNYDLSYQGNNLTITKALLNVIADGKTKVYGDADPSLTYQVSGLKNGDSAGSILTGGLNRDAGENVGVYGINQGGLVLTSGNYDLAYQGNDLTITKALLNVFADAKSKQVGTADPALTYQVSGLKNGDSAGQVLAGGLGRVGGEAVGQYDILQGGLALTSGNYQLNYQGNLLSILPLPVTPGDLGQLAALSDLRELQKGRDPDTPGDAVYRTTTLENPFLENPFLRAYALGMDVSDPNLLPATAAGPAEDASAKRVGQFTDRPLRAEAESGAGCSNQSYLADYWSCFNKPLNF